MTRALSSALAIRFRHYAQHLITLFCFFGTLLYSGIPASAASFNCAKAKTDIEKMICADGELSKLDATLSKLYSKTLISSGDTDEITKAERNWLKNVRNTCGTTECLNSTYHARIKQLARNFVSFDCEQAKTKVELLICGDDGLQYADMQLAQANHVLKNAPVRQKGLVADQKSWLKNVRDKCNDKTCLLQAMSSRTKVLQQQWDEVINNLKNEIGYTKHAFYSDMLTWPNDAHRVIALFATQASAKQGSTDDGPQQDEDFIVDLFVVDSANHKILQHGTDSITSDAIELTTIALDGTDYAAQLNAPVFGIVMSHEHHGCAGYSGTSMRLYEASGKNIKEILPEIETSASNGMCGTDCEYSSRQRDLKFIGQAHTRYPGLLIQERDKEAEENPKGPPGACKTKYSQKEYKLHFDGVKYPVPEGFEY